MTLYIVFEELQAGRLNLESRLKISKYAANQPPSKIGIRVGHPITVRTAIRALVTKSANDVATAVAENISGSERAFAERMTRTARSIGMKDTTFRNAHGLPNSQQRTTARDMAKLGRAIQERFPKNYEFFQLELFNFAVALTTITIDYLVEFQVLTELRPVISMRLDTISYFG